MDNTLRRVQAGAATYPSRLPAVLARGLVTVGGDALTPAGHRALARLDALLHPAAYPPSLLD